MYWVWNLTDLVFLRNHVVAPVAEEFVFRACMLPLLLQCFQPMTAVFIAPLFFGVGRYFACSIYLRDQNNDFRGTNYLEF